MRGGARTAEQGATALDRNFYINIAKARLGGFSF
jgi:hypothetical protein